MNTANARKASATTRARRRLPAVSIDSQSRQARRNSWCANQARERGAAHAACACSATSARNVSSRLVSPLPARRRSSSSVPSAISRAAGDDADAVGHALGDFEDVRGHDHGAAGGDALAQHVLDLPRRAGVEAGERLVENDELRVVHQRAGERHLLPHALGEAFAALVGVRRRGRASRSVRRRALARQPARCATARRRIRDIRTA